MTLWPRRRAAMVPDEHPSATPGLVEGGAAVRTTAQQEQDRWYDTLTGAEASRVRLMQQACPAMGPGLRGYIAQINAVRGLNRVRKWHSLYHAWIEEGLTEREASDMADEGEPVRGPEWGVPAWLSSVDPSPATTRESC